MRSDNISMLNNRFVLIAFVCMIFLPAFTMCAGACETDYSLITSYDFYG